MKALGTGTPGQTATAPDQRINPQSDREAAMAKPYNTCDSCMERYELNDDNAVLNLVQGEHRLDHILMVCSKGHNEAVFFRNKDERDELIRYQQFKVAKLKEAPGWVSEAWQLLYGPQQRKYVELTPRLETEVTNFGKLLDNLPDDMLMAVFQSPPPKSKLPERWS